MTQPLPDAAAQKQAAAEVFAQYEPPLYEAYLEMMLEWLAAVKAAMFTGGVARLGLIPDPIRVFSQGPKWAALTSQYTAKVAEEVLSAPYRDLFANGTLFESRPFVRNWISQRENRLSRVPDEVFGAVSKIIDSATTNGASIPDVAAQVEQLFDGTDVQKWKNRARTVARTEVVGAYNGGLYDAFAMIVENDPDTTYMKRWLATDDQRTRPDHREADGQLVPWGTPFDVGGFAMQYPHDPAGPPQEVINCVVGSTEVRWPGQSVQGSTRRRYSGAIVKLVTADGHNLTITPNHPVLTPAGYVPAGLLSPGQQVMATPQVGTPGVSDAPPSIEQVHRSASQSGIEKRVVGSRMDFHGDGAETEIQVVRPHGHLSLNLPPTQPGRLREDGLVGFDGGKVALSGASDGVVALIDAGYYTGGSSRATPPLVGGDGLRAPLGISEAGHPEVTGFAKSSYLKAHQAKSQDNGRTADADFLAHLQDALAAGMTPTEVVEIELLTESHDVFNLSTSDRWYSANGIAVHNCRCTLLLEIKNEPTEMSNRQYKDDLAAAGYPRSMTLMQFVCDDGSFCQQTHKPGLCKGQKRGQAEPGTEQEQKKTPAAVAKTAVRGLTDAIGRAQQIAQANAIRDPKLAAMARKAVADYQKALKPHVQTLQEAARADEKAKRVGEQDARQQDAMDKRDQKKRETLKKRAEAIIDRRKRQAAEQKKLKGMTPKQRAEYRKAKSEAARKQREAQENKLIKQANSA